jgi:hypothetical protein
MTKADLLKLQNYKRKSENRKKEEINILGLPFVKKTKDGIIFWSVKPSGNYNNDCQTGKAYGELAIKHMIQADFKPFLTWCVLDMPSKKNFSGIEVGFLEFFAEQAVSVIR